MPSQSKMSVSIAQDPTTSTISMSPISSDLPPNTDGVTGLPFHPNPIPSGGTILEAAFVDPAYSYPPAEGQGKFAIELQATPSLLHKVEPESYSDDGSSIASLSPSLMTTSTDGLSVTAAEREAEIELRKLQKTRTETIEEVEETYRGWGYLKCCKSVDNVVTSERQVHEGPTEEEIVEAKSKAKSFVLFRKSRKKQRRKSALAKKETKRLDRIQKNKKEFEETRAQSSNQVSEGLLVYRLSTQDHTISLLSQPNSNTDESNLLRHMVIARAYPSESKTRRGISLVGVDGTRATLEACEQGTAISWLEAIDMMLSHNRNPNPNSVARSILKKDTHWSTENLTNQQRFQIEEQYLNLAAYSNNLVRSGTIQKDNKTVGGIYYSVNTQHVEGEDYEEETLESIAKRRAVIKDSWDFYRMICSLLRDRRKYEETFRKMQLDPVYPYLNSMTGLNDPGNLNTYENTDKQVKQNMLTKYQNFTRTEICKDLIQKAEEALPSLVEICKALAGSLGMEEVGVGPIKEISAAIRKAEKKYAGDVTKITDYCRALLVVKDFPTLLAVLELARDSFGPLITRVKLTSLKNDVQPMPGGYRDCKINLELKDHICEIQIHLWPMWMVCGVDGFRHYRHCMEYSTDNFDDPYDALDGLDRKTMAEMIVMAEESVHAMPLDSMKWYHEKYILDYFAEVGIFIKHGHYVWAEITLRHLIKLRCESPDIGSEHHETLLLHKYLALTLSLSKSKDKKIEAEEINERLEQANVLKKKEKDDAEKSLFGDFFTDPWEAIDMMMDPSKKERNQEERRRKEVKASKKAWRTMRSSQFQFLDDANTYDSY